MRYPSIQAEKCKKSKYRTIGVNHMPVAGLWRHGMSCRWVGLGSIYAPVRSGRWI